MIGALILERNVLKVDLSRELKVFFGNGVCAAGSIHDFGNASRGNLCMGEHDDRKGRGNQRVEHENNILDHGENVTRRQAGAAPDHLSAEPDNQKHGDVQNKGRNRCGQRHGGVCFDQVFRHYMGCVGDAVMLMRLGIKCADHTDAADSFADNVVLSVAVFVRYFP